MSKQLLVFGETTFKITIPNDAKVTFGPWSPPNGKNGYGGDREAMKGTLRVYRKNKDNIIACFSGVAGFRDMGMEYAEQVAKEEGAVIWKSDKDGYQREEKVKHVKEWDNQPVALPAPKKGKKGKPPAKVDGDGEISF